MSEPCALPNLEEIVLQYGSHESREDGCCAMELVAWMAGEEHSDHPACTCPVLAATARVLNDRLEHEQRQLLKPFLVKLIGTARASTPTIRRKRMFLIIDWRIRELSCMLLELFGLGGEASQVRALPPINNIADLEAARPEVRGEKVIGKDKFSKEVRVIRYLDDGQEHFDLATDGRVYLTPHLARAIGNRLIYFANQVRAGEEPWPVVKLAKPHGGPQPPASVEDLARVAAECIGRAPE